MYVLLGSAMFLCLVTCKTHLKTNMKYNHDNILDRDAA